MCVFFFLNLFSTQHYRDNVDVYTNGNQYVDPHWLMNGTIWIHRLFWCIVVVVARSVRKHTIRQFVAKWHGRLITS